MADLGKVLQCVHQHIEQAKQVNAKDANAYVSICQLTSLKIAQGIRKEFGLPELKPPS